MKITTRDSQLFSCELPSSVPLATKTHQYLSKHVLRIQQSSPYLPRCAQLAFNHLTHPLLFITLLTLPTIPLSLLTPKGDSENSEATNVLHDVVSAKAGGLWKSNFKGRTQQNYTHHCSRKVPSPFKQRPGKLHFFVRTGSELGHIA